MHIYIPDQSLSHIHTINLHMRISYWEVSIPQTVIDQYITLTYLLIYTVLAHALQTLNSSKHDGKRRS